MHRHGYKGPKFGRRRDQRRALMRGLADSLVLNGSLETTMPRAKWLRSYTEKLITKAKKGDIHARRQLMADLSTKNAANKLVDEIAPKLKNRAICGLKLRLSGAATAARWPKSVLLTIYQPNRQSQLQKKQLNRPQQLKKSQLRRPRNENFQC
jgi:large subunit ribosomal protein L17